MPRLVLQKILTLLGDKLSEFHMQAGLTDRSGILFNGGACASCCPERFASDYPSAPLKEESPKLKRLFGKTLEVLGRRMVQLDCRNGHSLTPLVFSFMCVKESRSHW